MQLKPPTSIDNMRELRAQIDALDAELVRLFAQRQAHIDRAAEIKPSAGLPARIESRVEEVVGKVVDAAKAAGFDPVAAEQMWRILIDQMIAREEDVMGANRNP